MDLARHRLGVQVAPGRKVSVNITQTRHLFTSGPHVSMCFYNYLGDAMKTCIFAIALIFSSAYAFAHSGGTDSNGCHTNHKTGERHCH